MTPTHSKTNYCRQCPIAPLCLPAKLDQKALNTLDILQFKSVTLSPGEHLCRQGELLDHLFMIRSGILKSYIDQEDGQEFVMDFHIAPELFGWEGIDAQQRAFSITALDHSSICVLPMTKFNELMAQYPKIQAQLIAFFSQRLRNDNIVMQRTNVQQRVANFLLQLSAHYKQLGYPYYLCKLLMTHQDIANYLRIAPETISRTFHRLQQQQIIKLEKKSVYLLDIKKLQQLATPK